MKREQSMYFDWTNEDHFNLMNMSDKPSFQAPGFKELGVQPQCILPTVHESATGYYVSYSMAILFITFIFQPGMVTNFKLFNEIDRPPTYEWDSTEVDDALQLAS